MKNKMPNHPSSHLLEAMLYVQNDPFLDRDEFEQRLADDPALGESVAEAVGLLQDIRSLCATQTRPVVTVAGSSHAQQMPVAFWQWSISIAASTALIAYVSWQYFVFERNNHNQLANVVNAWSDLHQLDGLDNVEDAKLRSVGLESELTPEADEVLDEDFPDWLISATVAPVAVSAGETIQ
jgi:hypothetical protein